MKWIKVEDRLPAVSQMVLCYMPLSYNGCNGIHYGWLSPKYDWKGNHNGVSWREHSPNQYAHEMEDHRFTGTTGSRVTHWTSLPKPPDVIEEVK